MQKFVTIHVLGSGKFLSAYITGILVVGVGTVGFQVLCKFAGLAELLAALGAGVGPGARVGERKVAVLLLHVAEQPAFCSERLVATLKHL